MFLLTDLQEMVRRSDGALTVEEVTPEFVILNSTIGIIKFSILDDTAA